MSTEIKIFLVLQNNLKDPHPLSSEFMYLSICVTHFSLYLSSLSQLENTKKKSLTGQAFQMDKGSVKKRERKTKKKKRTICLCPISCIRVCVKAQLEEGLTGQY